MRKAYVKPKHQEFETHYTTKAKKNAYSFR